MKNITYYLILCIASTLLFVYTLWNKKDNKLVALYFFIAGYTYFLEYFVLVLFNGYSYSPNVMQNDYYDNILGAIASDAFVIPMMSVFTAGLKLSFVKRLFIASIITVIEVIFVSVNVFDIYWWKHSYTFAGGVITFSFAQKWLSIIQWRISNIVRFANLFFSNLFIQCSISFILASIFNLFFYNTHWYNNPYRSHIAFATLYIIFITVTFVSIVVFRLNWFCKTLGILLPSVTDIILLNMNILRISVSWSLLGFLVFRTLIFICITCFNKYLLTENCDIGSTQ